LELDVYSGANGTFALYEDDGITENFDVNGAKSVTNLAYTDAAARVVINHPAGTYAGAPATRRYLVRIHGLTAPISMRGNGGTTLPSFSSEATAIVKGSGAVWDPAKKILSVVTPSIAVVTNGGVAATVEPSGCAVPAPDRRNRLPG
jgi:Domain of unknown function (DUF5110)